MQPQHYKALHQLQVEVQQIQVLLYAWSLLQLLQVLCAPVYEQNARGRYVYLPEEMMLVRMKSYDNYETEILPKGHHYVPVALDELVFFIRNQKAIPFAEPAESTAKTDLSTLRLLGYADASYELYTDNGVSPDPEDSLSVSTL